MKKIAKKINMALIGIMAVSPAMAAVDVSGMCKLLADLRSVFSMIRMLAFVGAAFIIANWAWGYISSGKVEMKDLKDKGTGMLVGFILLFGVGMVLSFLLSSAGGQSLGCYDELLHW